MAWHLLIGLKAMDVWSALSVVLKHTELSVVLKPAPAACVVNALHWSPVCGKKGVCKRNIYVEGDRNNQEN